VLCARVDKARRAGALALHRLGALEGGRPRPPLRLGRSVGQVFSQPSERHAPCSLPGERVILAHDLARIYGVETRALNQAVKRNADMFPGDFIFQVNSAEAASLKSQAVTSTWGGARRALPYAFTEHGAVVLRSAALIGG